MIRLYRHKKPIIVIIIKKALVVYTQLSIAFSIIHNMTWNGESKNRSTSGQPHIFRTPLQKVTKDMTSPKPSFVSAFHPSLPTLGPEWKLENLVDGYWKVCREPCQVLLIRR